MKFFFDHEKLDVARGSALECAACLDVMVVRGLVAQGSIAAQKEQLSRIVQMLMGMLRKFSGRADLLREDEGTYADRIEHEHETGA
jgi:hypothetical protein